MREVVGTVEEVVETLAEPACLTQPALRAVVVEEPAVVTLKMFDTSRVLLGGVLVIGKHGESPMPRLPHAAIAAATRAGSAAAAQAFVCAEAPRPWARGRQWEVAPPAPVAASLQ